MKKTIPFLLIFALIFTLAGCAAAPSENSEALDQLSGTWRSDDEKISINGVSVEIVGYYTMEGQRVAGVATPGTISLNDDGTFTLKTDSYEMEGYLKDENTLVLDGREYTR